VTDTSDCSASADTGNEEINFSGETGPDFFSRRTAINFEICRMSIKSRREASIMSASVLFVEEPLPATDKAGYSSLAKSSPVTIAAGEHVQSHSDFLFYMNEGILGVIQPDLAMVGGITPILDICTMGAGPRCCGLAAFPSWTFRADCGSRSRYSLA
jgi:hypothetical protein